ncbi:MAG TPA: ABC transporter substrate-binding protein, partial [Acidimicrobiales bacterium]|nr:ABC transporter substrate-binding protein [Acidimicrobiales bacterium]
MKRSLVRRASILLGTVMCAAGLTAQQALAAPHQHAGGTPDTAVTYAQLPGNLLNYIFPLTPAAYDTVPNIQQFQFMVYPPLYWYASPGHVGLVEKRSIAELPVLSVSGGRSVATIRLKPWRWSDGRPITARDVQFFWNLLRANKTAWWAYIPSEFPDNVVSFKILGTDSFSVTFDAEYSEPWINTELAQLFAIPQHAWDKTSLDGRIGNYDETPAGARAVYNFLNAQSKDISTYATNPLWQVVDGPWVLSAFTPETTALTLRRNPDYSGPAGGNVETVRELQYTSDAAEFNALLAGQLDFGYIPFTDFAEISRVRSLGYEVEPWYAFGASFIPLNYANSATGPIFKQLYAR